MSLYARPSWQLARQITADLFVIVWAVIWVLVGRFVTGAIGHVADPARQLVTTAQNMETSVTEAGNSAAGVPAVGESLQRPFQALAEQLAGVAGSAQAQVNAIENVALIVGILVAVIPIATLLVIWLPRRIRFAVTNSAGQQFLDSPADLDLFALRAMSTQPLHVLARISDDPVTAWRAGDRRVIAALAELELRAAGLRMPAVDGRVEEQRGR